MQSGDVEELPVDPRGESQQCHRQEKRRQAMESPGPMQDAGHAFGFLRRAGHAGRCANEPGMVGQLPLHVSGQPSARSITGLISSRNQQRCVLCHHLRGPYLLGGTGTMELPYSVSLSGNTDAIH